ncbi:hypothetical protein D3C75_1188940 [compost metagenome]
MVIQALLYPDSIDQTDHIEAEPPGDNQGRLRQTDLRDNSRHGILNLVRVFLAYGLKQHLCLPVRVGLSFMGPHRNILVADDPVQALDEAVVHGRLGLQI